MDKKAFFDNIRKEANTVLLKVFDKVEEVSKISALKFKISGLKAQIRDQKTEMGDFVYNNQKVFKENAEIQEYIKKIKKIVDYPVLIRPRISSGSRGIKRVEKPSEFDDAYDQIKVVYGEPIIQEHVKKTGYATACLLLDDNQTTGTIVSSAIPYVNVNGYNWDFRIDAPNIKDTNIYRRLTRT